MSASYDLCVIGAGSGGFGAACAAARLGMRVVLVEASKGLGGTSTWAGVNNYEPVAGATGLPWEVYDRLRRRPRAVSLQSLRARYHPERPWGWYDCAEETDYRLSLSRPSGVPTTFEPSALEQVMREMLEETGRCTTFLQTRFAQVEKEGRQIRSILVEGPEGNERIEAPLFVDATADIYVARAAGCQSAIGPENRAAYDEPSAEEGEQGELVLNNASPCYRVARLARGEEKQIQPPPDDVDRAGLKPVTSIRTYPNGDLNMNPLHLMTGREAYELGDRAYSEAIQRSQAHWHVLQTQYGFETWKRVWTSLLLGVRESHRLVGRYVLKEQDLDAGLARQDHDDIVAIADHSIDFHGARPSREVPNGPYGIPFRCLLPNEIDNLLVSCRGASFSSIGASSCRLSRTMMVLGQVAGTAAALFGAEIQNFSPEKLRQQLRRDGVALDLESGYLDVMPDIEPLKDKGFKGEEM